jgi:RND family efflux transporter MFP subunit
MTMERRRNACFGLAAALGVLGAASGCQGREQGQKSLTAVRVQRLEAGGAAAAGARYSATIEPATRVDLAFKVGGYVESIAKASGGNRILQEGDAVTSGERLVSVRQTDYFQKRDQAKAALSAAQAASQQAKMDYDRASHLQSKQDIAMAELDGAKAKLDTTKAAVDGARAQLEEAQTAIADSTLKSPMNGIIAKRGVEVGTLAGPGTMAFVIVDVKNVKVVFGVPDTVLTKLKVGASQVVTLEAFRGDSFTGSITRIAPVADARSRVFEVELTIPNGDNRLRPGMVAALNVKEAKETVAHDQPTATVQLSAVVRAPTNPAKYAVFVVDEQNGHAVAHCKEVELGDFMGNVVPVLSGLSLGQKVVVTGASFLSEGDPVQVLP